MPPNALRVRQIRQAGFLLALCLLAAVGGAAVWSYQGAVNSFDWVEHTHGVMSSIQAYRADVRSAESAARGYRLSRRSGMRDALLETVPVIRQGLRSLAAQVSDNPEQEARVLSLAALTERRMALSLRLVGSLDAAGEQAAIRDGARLMADIDRLTTRMLADEATLLADRRATNDRQTRLLALFTGGGTAFALLMLALLLRSLLQENRRARHLEREARVAMDSLNVSMERLAHLSEQRGVLSRYASLLQSCQDVQETLQVTGHVLGELIAGAGGRCYLMHASQDLLEASATFGTPVLPSSDLLQPLQCWALRKGQPYRLDHVGDGVRCAHVHADDAALDAWSLCVPLLAQGAALGMLHVNGRGGIDRVQTQDVVETVAEQLALALVNLQLRDTLRVQSLRDVLTGLFNRRYLDESLHREITRCERHGQPLAVMMLDVDHFKAFNDTHGHAAGDALLARVGALLRTMSRNEDLVCRYGGEEFTIVLPETSADEALRRARELIAAIATTTVQHMRETIGPCTASIGIAMLPGDGDAAAALLAQADAALYRAKSEGRNRVVITQRSPTPSATPAT
jgi:diguanylate cyclase (GGDEF)-like protein